MLKFKRAWLRISGAAVVSLNFLLGTVSIAKDDHAPIHRSLNRDAISHIDWQNVASSPFWKQIGLSPNGDDVTINLYGMNFKSRWSGGTLYLQSADRPTCEPILPKIKGELGPPIENDGSIVIPFSETVSMKMISLIAQWEMGNSRVNVMCFGSVSSPPLPDSPDKLSWTIAVGAIDKLAKLVPRFALRCARTLNFSDGTSRPVTEMAIWIDPTMKDVTSADRVVIADNGSFSETDGQIAFSITRNQIKSDYRIDRFTGALSATMTQGTSQTGTISGSCEKSATLGQKF